MKVHGYTIPDDAVAAGVEAMVQLFTSPMVEDRIYRVIVEKDEMMPSAWGPAGIAAEAANRLLQRERRAGRIAYDRSALMWSRIEGETS